MAKNNTLSPEDREAEREARKIERARSRGQLIYALRVLVLLVALGVTIWVYGGDVYVTGTLILCGLGVFAAGIAPGLIPEMGRHLVLMPFVLGVFIPIWRLLDALLRWERMPIIQAAVVLGVYVIAVLMLKRLPVRMRDPFIRWLPKGAIPDEEAEALRKKAREREADERKAQKARDKQAARAEREAEKAEKDRAASGGKKRFGWGRGKAAESEAQPAAAASGGKSNPFFKSGAGESAGDKDKDSGGGKKRFGWGRGKAAESEAQPAAAASGGKSNPFFKSGAGESAGDKDKDSGGGKKRFGWGRGKAAESDAAGKPAEKSAPAASQPFYNEPASSGASTNPFFYEDDADDEPDVQDGYGWQNRYGTSSTLSNVSAFLMDDDEDDAPTYSTQQSSPSISSDEETDELIEKIRAMRRKQRKGL